MPHFLKSLWTWAMAFSSLVNLCRKLSKRRHIESWRLYSTTNAPNLRFLHESRCENSELATVDSAWSKHKHCKTSNIVALCFFWFYNLFCYIILFCFVSIQIFSVKFCTFYIYFLFVLLFFLI